jgi:DNA ligase-1
MADIRSFFSKPAGSSKSKELEAAKKISGDADGAKAKGNKEKIQEKDEMTGVEMNGKEIDESLKASGGPGSTPGKSISEGEKDDDLASAPPRKRLRQVTDSDDSDDENSPSASKPAETAAKAPKADEKTKAPQKGAKEPAAVAAESKASTKQSATSKATTSAESKADAKKPKTEPKFPAKEQSGKSTSAKQSEDKSEDKPEDAASDEEEGIYGDDDEASEAVMKLETAGFDALKEATWKKGEPVPYAHLAQAFEKIEATKKRLEITAILTRALRTVIETTPSDLLACVYLCVNKLAPAHEGIELGLGDMILKKSLAEATGRQEKDIKADYDKVFSSLFT